MDKVVNLSILGHPINMVVVILIILIWWFAGNRIAAMLRS